MKRKLETALKNVITNLLHVDAMLECRAPRRASPSSSRTEVRSFDESRKLPY
jgi:hypothetical protein